MTDMDTIRTHILGYGLVNDLDSIVEITYIITFLYPEILAKSFHALSFMTKLC